MKYCKYLFELLILVSKWQQQVGKSGNKHK